MRTSIIGAAVVVAAGLVALGVGTLTAGNDNTAGGVAPTAARDEHDKHYEACAKVCAECQVECDKMFHHCFTQVEAGKKDHATVAHLSIDCAELCAATARLTARHSPLSAAACGACATACETCAAACEKFPNMPEMKACAAKCRECATACKEMAKMTGHDHEKK